MLKLTAIHIYPIKGTGGISLTQSQVTKRGLQYDRRWQVVDENGKFFTQRDQRELTLLQVEDVGESFLVKHKIKNNKPLLFPKEPTDCSSKMTVSIWKDTVQACIVGKNQSDWFSEILGTKCHLVYMPETTHRKVNPKYSEQGDVVSFADGFPILILGEASLNDLNRRLEEPLPMNRFRPNLVFNIGASYEEDDWQLIQIGPNNVFRGGKPCQRCIVTTINQESGKAGKEPLKTLASFRHWGDGVYFGMNLIWDEIKSKGSATIQIGDEINILKKEKFDKSRLI